MRTHPQGVQPLSHLGLGVSSHANNARRMVGLGNLCVLSDELLLQILHELDPSTLAILSCVSKAFYCYANHEELWRAIVLSGEGQWVFDRSWKRTCVNAREKAQRGEKCARTRSSTNGSIKVSDFYSDALYQPFLCSALDVDESWLEVENIDRRSNLTLEEFQANYENRNVPVIITDVVENWKAYDLWDLDYLKRSFGASSVIVGDAPMPFDAYLAYCDQQHDEAPLYLFDKEFCDKAPAMATEYSVPTYFREDLFSVLKDKRPDHRWLIYGPPKSGSTFHKDPNATSAWNAVVYGSKKWIMYPPHVMPPGVRQSEDGADVSCPVSLMEWMLAFYDLRDCEGATPREAVVKRGEILFVPRGWWHCAINLEDTLAITQNYVSRANLRHVLKFLKSPHANVLVSGVPDEECVTLSERFTTALEREGFGELLRDVERQEETLNEKRKSSSALTGCFAGSGVRAPVGEEGGSKRQATGFSFGFL